MSTKEIQEDKVRIPKKNALLVIWYLIYTMYFPSVLVSFAFSCDIYSSSGKRDHIRVLENCQITSVLKWLTQFLG